MMMKKKILSLVMVVMMVFMVGAVYGDGLIRDIQAVFNSEMSVKVNGNFIHSDEKGAIVYNDRTYVPARALAEALKADVQWDEATQTVNINRLGKIDVTKIKTVADKYLVGPDGGKGSLTKGIDKQLINIDVQAIADMGFRVGDYGDKTFEMINISHPRIAAGEDSGNWKDGVFAVGTVLSEQFYQKWNNIGLEKNVGPENVYTETFIKDGIVAILIVNKNSVGIVVRQLEDYIQDRIKDAVNAPSQG